MHTDSSTLDSMFDINESLRQKQAGMEQTRSANEEWFSRARTVAVQWLVLRAGKRMVGEDIRAAVLREMEPPRSPNVWGPLIRNLEQSGKLSRTGMWVPMTAKRSHARLTPQYESKI